MGLKPASRIRFARELLMIATLSPPAPSLIAEIAPFKQGCTDGLKISRRDRLEVGLTRLARLAAAGLKLKLILRIPSDRAFKRPQQNRRRGCDTGRSSKTIQEPRVKCVASLGIEGLSSQ